MDYMAQPPYKPVQQKRFNKKKTQNDGKKWVAGVLLQEGPENQKIINIFILFITLSDQHQQRRVLGGLQYSKCC